jgi:hypothetical protein
MTLQTVRCRLCNVPVEQQHSFCARCRVLTETVQRKDCLYG